MTFWEFVGGVLTWMIATPVAVYGGLWIAGLFTGPSPLDQGLLDTGSRSRQGLTRAGERPDSPKNGE